MKVGSLVECIKQLIPDDWDKKYGLIFPVKGETYIVRDLHKDRDGFIGLRLEEIINQPAPFRDGMLEAAFYIELFRELQPPMDLSFINQIEEYAV